MCFYSHSILHQYIYNRLRCDEREAASVFENFKLQSSLFSMCIYVSWSHGDKSVGYSIWNLTEFCTRYVRIIRIWVRYDVWHEASVLLKGCPFFLLQVLAGHWRSQCQSLSLDSLCLSYNHVSLYLRHISCVSLAPNLTKEYLMQRVWILSSSAE